MICPHYKKWADMTPGLNSAQCYHWDDYGCDAQFDLQREDKTCPQEWVGKPVQTSKVKSDCHQWLQDHRFIW